MMNTTCHLSVSLDGFAAGPDQRVDQPLGAGGLRLHDWMFSNGDSPAHQADAEVLDEVLRDVGAYIMGRNMFASTGAWDPNWRGFWGEDPPFHTPVFVLTKHHRDPLPMSGGTTFSFVSDGIESALRQARAAASDRSVGIAGGANVVRQYLTAGLLDELYLHIVPITLGGGERLLDDVGDVAFEQVKVVASPAVTHIRYRIRHQD